MKRSQDDRDSRVDGTQPPFQCTLLPRTAPPRPRPRGSSHLPFVKGNICLFQTWLPAVCPGQSQERAEEGDAERKKRKGPSPPEAFLLPQTPLPSQASMREWGGGEKGPLKRAPRPCRCRCREASPAPRERHTGCRGTVTAPQSAQPSESDLKLPVLWPGCSSCTNRT